MPETLVFPSLLACDFARLGEESVDVIERGADGLHYDVMDGHFVGNITIGAGVLGNLRRYLDEDPRMAGRRVHLDVHVMIDAPERYADAFIDAGADTYTFHLEAAADAAGLIKRIHERGVRAGVALRPDTPADGILPLLGDIDLALPMTVQPGWGGQGYIEAVEEKIRVIREAGPDGLDVQVDGGITDRSAIGAAAAGANLLVAGSYIFKARDRRAAIAAVRAAAGNPIGK